MAHEKHGMRHGTLLRRVAFSHTHTPPPHLHTTCIHPLYPYCHTPTHTHYRTHTHTHHPFPPLQLQIMGLGFLLSCTWKGGQDRMDRDRQTGVDMNLQTWFVSGLLLAHFCAWWRGVAWQQYRALYGGVWWQWDLLPFLL